MSQPSLKSTGLASACHRVVGALHVLLRSITDELARKYNASVHQMLAYLTIEGRQQGIP